jgi:RimJ/RimL family protein N-acetyltransferase
MPDATLEVLARSLQKEGVQYGFSKLDFIRFVNVLLDIAIMDSGNPSSTTTSTGDDGTCTTAPPMTGLPSASGRIQLRRFHFDFDADLMFRWLEDPHGRYFRLSCATARYKSCEELLECNSDQLAIVTLRDGTPIGAMAYLDYDPEQGRAELRKLIGEPAARGLGYAREATQLWIRYGFEVLKLRKIYLHTLDTALRNIRLNESLGFVVEGILRNEIVFEGVARDVLRMGLCR